MSSLLTPLFLIPRPISSSVLDTATVTCNYLSNIFTSNLVTSLISSTRALIANAERMHLYNKRVGLYCRGYCMAQFEDEFRVRVQVRVSEHSWQQNWLYLMHCFLRKQPVAKLVVSSSEISCIHFKDTCDFATGCIVKLKLELETRPRAEPNKLHFLSHCNLCSL